MKIDRTQSPYYDDYDRSKGYSQLLAVPGRVAQAREFTQAQTITRDIIKALGDSLMHDGDVIEGCQVIVSADKTFVTVTDGKVYVDGIVSDFSEQTVSITGTGTEVIGILLVEELVDENMDITLRDPAQGYDNYNRAGCHRLKRNLQLVVNNSGAATITTLVDGELYLDNYSPEFSTLNQTLARRTYDESGSYIVSGLNVRVENDPDSPDNYVAVVESGKAYVLGYELGIASARRIKVPRSTDVGRVTSQFQRIASENESYVLSSSGYAADIVSVQGWYPVTRESHSIGFSTDRSQLAVPDVSADVDITPSSYRVYLDNGKEYIPGVDYNLMQTDSRWEIIWLGKDYPVVESTYYVDYRYYHTFKPSTTPAGGLDQDYYLDNNSELRWTSDGKAPISGTIFRVFYNQYYARKDVIYIDRFGEISVKQGIPARYGSEVSPEEPMDTLTLAAILSPPNSVAEPEVGSSQSPISVTNVGLTRFTMRDIQSLLERVRVLEYDNAVNTLNQDALEEYTVNDKKGVWTDPFVDLSRIDYGYNINGITHDVMIDLYSNLCYLPESSKVFDPEYDPATTTAHIYGRLASLPVTGERSLLSQPHATKVFLINPYSIFPGTPEISLDPAVDNWIDETIIQVAESLTRSTVVSTSSRHLSKRVVIHRVFNTYSRTTSKTSDTQIGTTVETVTNDSVLSEEAITYIRQREVNVSGTDFPMGIDNIYGYFDDVQVALVPTGTTSAGTAPGTIKAGSDGKFTCKFMIPEGRLCGTREVRLQSTVDIDGWTNSATAAYQASGINRIIQRTVTTITTVLLHRSITYTKTTYVDPVGQTFVLDRMAFVKAIDLYFENKPDDSSTTATVIVEIRGVTNGLIDSTQYGLVSKAPAEVNVSPDASKVTRFEFKDPVLLEADTEYAFVVRSAVDDYRIWAAELGGQDILTGDTVLKNAYLEGNMMSSSNNSAWTIHQTTDLKFNLVEDVYSNFAVLNFKEVTGAEAAKIYLTADAAIPTGTSVRWEYSLNKGVSFTSITPYTDVILDSIQNLADSVKLRATLSSESKNNLSPMIALDTVVLNTAHWDLEGNYIGKNIGSLDDYDEAQIIVDTYTPAGTSIEFYVSDSGDPVDGVIHWYKCDEVPEKTEYKDFGWYEKTYRVSTSSSSPLPPLGTVEYRQNARVRVRLTSNEKYITPAFRRLRAIFI